MLLFFSPQSTLAEGELIFKYRKLNSIHMPQFGGQFFALCLFQLGKEATNFRPRTVPPLVMGNLSYLSVQLVLIL